MKNCIKKAMLTLMLLAAIIPSVGFSTVYASDVTTPPDAEASDVCSMAETDAAQDAEEIVPALIKSNEYAAIDYTHAHEGYIKVKYTGQSEMDVSVYVFKDNKTITAFPLTCDSDWVTLSLHAGDGDYSIVVYKMLPNDRVRSLLRLDLNVTVTDPANLVSNGYAIIDTSNIHAGTYRLKYTADTQNNVSVYLISDNGVKSLLTYDIPLTPGEWYTLPLTAESASYFIMVEEDTEDGSYIRFRHDLDVTIEVSPSLYLTSHPMIDYNHAPNTVALAKSITAACATDVEKADTVYRYVASHISYDYEGMDSGFYPNNYVPDLDVVLEAGKGICGHFASLMCGMLRSQNIPSKMEYGYISNGGYHAWVSVYFPDSGWVRYDPTFVSTADGPEDVNYTMSYIANDANYLVCETY